MPFLVLMSHHVSNKMPTNKNKQSRPGVTPGKHVYRGVRDPIVLDARSNPLAQSPLAAATEIGNRYVLSPLGVQGVSIGTDGTPTIAQTIVPTLPFLFSTARNFKEYRVTRAVLIFVGQQSSTAVGRITLSSSTDHADDFTAPGQYGLVDARSFDMAGACLKEARHQMLVDPTWKKVSTVALGFYGKDLLPVNTINDLCFSVAGFSATGTSGSGNIGALFVEYDVEFRYPTQSTRNL